VRVLKWILERLQGRVEARETAIGYVPVPQDLDLEGLDLPSSTVEELLRVDRDEWQKEVADQGQFLAQLGERVPEELWEEFRSLERRLG